MATTTAILALTLSAALLSYVAYQVFLSPLRNVPGPFWAKFFPLWRVYRVMLGNWHEDIVKLHDQYGIFICCPLLCYDRYSFTDPTISGTYVRIAPNEVSTTSSLAVRVAYSHTGNPWVKVRQRCNSNLQKNDLVGLTVRLLTRTNGTRRGGSILSTTRASPRRIPPSIATKDGESPSCTPCPTFSA